MGWLLNQFFLGAKANALCAGSMQLYGVENVSHCMDCRAFADDMLETLGSYDNCRPTANYADLKAMTTAAPDPDPSPQKQPSELSESTDSSGRLSNFLEMKGLEPWFSVAEAGKKAMPNSVSSKIPETFWTGAPAASSSHASDSAQDTIGQSPEPAQTHFEEPEPVQGEATADGISMDTTNDPPSALDPVLASLDSLLCVAPPWCELLVDGSKTWELRSYVTHKRITAKCLVAFLMVYLWCIYI